MPPVLVGASRFSFAVHISLSLSLSHARETRVRSAQVIGELLRARVLVPNEQERLGEGSQDLLNRFKKGRSYCCLPDVDSSSTDAPDAD